MLTKGAQRKTLHYAYDEAGYLNLVQDGEVVTSYNTINNLYTPDPFGRVYAESTNLDGQTFTTEYSYDVMGRLTGVGTPDGEWVHYAYNKLGELTQVPGYLKQAPSYDRVGRLTELVAANGVVQNLSYDQNSRLVGLSYQGQGERFKEYSYGYDQANNMVRKNNDQFSYDALNQLVFASLVGSFEIKGEDYPLLKGRAFNDHFGQETIQFNLASSDIIMQQAVLE